MDFSSLQLQNSPPSSNKTMQNIKVTWPDLSQQCQLSCTNLFLSLLLCFHDSKKLTRKKFQRGRVQFHLAGYKVKLVYVQWKSEQKLSVEIQKQELMKNQGRILLIGLFSMVCSVYFLLQISATCSRMAPPHLAGTSHINH